MIDVPGEFRPLPRDFYVPSAKVVAPKLLGHFLLRRTPEGLLVGGEIVEAEAYLQNDPACHASAGMTPRTRTMFGEPGRAYVYLIYGFYNCFNAVCCPQGEAEAILVRAVEARWGVEWMRAKRPVAKDTQLTSGPGKLCVAMDIDRTLDAVDLCDSRSPLFIAENPDLRKYRRTAGPIVTTTRIGINVAADWKLRFYLEKSQFVSRKVRLPRH